MIPMMVMVCVIEKSSEVTIFETVKAVIKVFLVKTSALSVIAFIVTVEVGQQIPANKVVESISEKNLMSCYSSSGALSRHQQRRFFGSAKTPIMATSSSIV